MRKGGKLKCVGLPCDQLSKSWSQLTERKTKEINWAPTHETKEIKKGTRHHESAIEMIKQQANVCMSRSNGKKAK